MLNTWEKGWKTYKPHLVNKIVQCRLSGDKKSSGVVPRFSKGDGDWYLGVVESMDHTHKMSEF